MSKKLEHIHNFFIITDTVTLETLEYPTKDLFYMENSDNIAIMRNYYNNHLISFKWQDAIDSDDNSFTNKSELVHFLRLSIGDNGEPLDFYTEVQKGSVHGHSIVHKFGAIASVGSTITPVTSSGNFPTPNSLVNLEVVSDDTQDSATGTGMRTINLSAISDVNGSWTEQNIVVSLDGTNAVALPNGVYRVYRMKGLTSGTYATDIIPSHNSTITLRVAGAGATWHQIETENSFGLSQSEIAVYTIPKDKTGYLVSKKISVEGSKAANVYLFTRENADVVTAPYSTMNVKELERNLTGTNVVKPHSPILILPGATDVGFMASADVGTTSVSVDFEILLVDNHD